MAIGRWLTALVVGLAGLGLILVGAGPVGPLGVLGGLGVALWIAVDAARVAGRAPADYALRPYNRWYVYVGLVVLVGIAWELAIGRRYEAYRIPSGAMEPTVLIGDFIFVATGKTAPGEVRHGSIIVFAAVDEPGLSQLKRVVGLPGDTIHMIASTLYRNGRAIVEPYVGTSLDPSDPEDPKMRAWQADHLVGEADRRAYRPTLKNWGPLLVPRDSVFVLGDNRDRSFDSRYYGYVGFDRIHGQPTRIYYSYDRLGVLPLPFLTAIRWRRVGKRL